jgi:tRNA modification GTPase
MDLDDTIAAIASAPGGALRGIVRISGPQCIACVRSLVRAQDRLALDAIKRPSCLRTAISLGAPLGEVPLTLYVWPTARSYTRQPSAELHLPGSPPILEAALAAVCKSGARLARPGEFTLRALLAGRLDLTQAEAVLGVIDARSQAELNVALGQLAGGLARPLGALREQLLELLAHLEAGLDFVDEDIDFITAVELDRQLADAHRQIEELASRMQTRGQAGNLPRVVLIGRPNAGKSSLLNALTGDSAALVSNQAGTTRDFVGRKATLGSRECVIVDTAGLSPEHAGDELAQAGQRMTQSQVEQADLTVLCLDSSRPLVEWDHTQSNSQPTALQLIVWTKCDLPAAADLEAPLDAIKTSSVRGAGISELRSAIARQLAAMPLDSAVIPGTADRCRESLRLAGAALARARAASASSGGEELVAAEVRLALEEIGKVVGTVYTEDVLDRIFSRFCIGK